MRKPDATTVWIDEQSMAAFGKAGCGIETGYAQGNLRSESRAMTALDQLGHIDQGHLMGERARQRR